MGFAEELQKWRRIKYDYINDERRKDYVDNRETIRAQRKSCYDSEKENARHKRYYLANREKERERGRRYQAANPEKAKLREKRRDRTKKKAYNQRNAEKIKLQKVAYRQANYARIRAREKLYQKEYSKRPIRRIAARYRDRIRILLKSSKARRSCKTTKLLGCDIQWLMAWLEVHFMPGMTWENYGPVWHVDHKRPCASFDLTDPAQQRICFHWTNLQPLFAKDNLAKRARW